MADARLSDVRPRNFFAQPFFCAEPWTRRPGSYVTQKDMLRACTEILDGLHDDLPVWAAHTTFDDPTSPPNPRFRESIGISTLAFSSPGAVIAGGRQAARQARRSSRAASTRRGDH
jgi:hypothetical protein